MLGYECVTNEEREPGSEPLDGSRTASRQPHLFFPAVLLIGG
jgi:hypothetical protein